MAVDNPSYFSVSGPSGSNPAGSGTASRSLGNIFKRRRHVNKMGGGMSSASVGSTSTSALTHASGRSAPSTPTEEMVPILARATGQQSSTRRSFKNLFRSTSANSNDERMKQFLKGFPRPSDVAPPSPYLPHRSHSHSEKDRKQPERRRVLKSTSELLNTDSTDSHEIMLESCVVDGHRYTNVNDDDNDEIEDESQSVTEIHLSGNDVRYYNLSSTLPTHLSDRRRHSIGTFFGKEKITSSSSTLKCDPKKILGEIPPIPTEQEEICFSRSRRKTTRGSRSGTLSSAKCDSADEDVIFISSKDSDTATLWVEYLTSWFEKISHQQGRKVPFKVKHMPIEDPILPGTEEKIRRSRLQIIIICPILLECVLKRPEQASLLTSYFNTEKVLAMMLGVHDVHVTNNHKISLAFYSLWRKFFVKDQDVTFVGEFLGSAISIMGTGTTNTLRSDRTFFSIHPKKVKVGQSRVLALLNDPLRPEDKVEVIVDRCGEAIEIISVKRRNPYVIQFSIPERCLEVSMLVGVRISKNGCPLGVRQVKCESRLRELDQILRAHDNPLEFMCQTFGFNPGDREQLDNWMVHAFQRNVPPHFNLLSNPHGLVPSKTGASQDEYPTLLHFAARFGLEKLAWQLLECPGGDLACDMRNFADMTPADLAENAGHGRLAHQLRGYMQMNEFTNMYSYLKVMSESSHENMSGNEKALSEANKDDCLEDYCTPRPLNEAYCIPPAARPVAASINSPTPSLLTPLNAASGTSIQANYSIAPTPLPVSDAMPAPPNNNLDSSLQGYLQMSPVAGKKETKGSSTTSSRVGTPTLNRHESFHSVKDEMNHSSHTLKRGHSQKPIDSGPQDELLEIINDFKNKIFTIEEMERLVENWRNRNDVQQSFKEKQRQLNDMREEYERIQKKMKEEMKMPTPFDRIKKFFGKGKKDHHMKNDHSEHKGDHNNGSSEHRPVSSLSLHSVSSSSSSGRMSTVSGCSGTSLGDSGTHSDAEDRRLQHSSGGLLSYEIPPTPKPFGARFCATQNKYVTTTQATNNEFDSQLVAAPRTLVHDKEFCIAFPPPGHPANSFGVIKEPKTPSSPDFLDLSEIDIHESGEIQEKTKNYANMEVIENSLYPPPNMCIPKEYVDNDDRQKPSVDSAARAGENGAAKVDKEGATGGNEEGATRGNEEGAIADVDVPDFGGGPVPDYMNVCPLGAASNVDQGPPVPPRIEHL